MIYIITFVFGAFGYCLAELLWRGYTHWTMAPTGGLCMLLVFLINESFPSADAGIKCLLGSIVITSVELIVGITVNVILKWNVWDYSSIPFNFMGQICLPYTVLWYFLCIPMLWICSQLSRIF